MTMFRKLVLTGIYGAVLSTAAFAQTAEYGTAEEARAMLEKAVAAVKSDKAKALDLFNKGEGGFKDRDLYVFCANAFDGIETAHPTHKGVKLTDVKDVNGFAAGREMMRTATEGKISEIAYLWPRPSSEMPVHKITFFTKSDDQICGVGYYR
jgi:signal transduction histidine kinase